VAEPAPDVTAVEVVRADVGVVAGTVVTADVEVAPPPVDAEVVPVEVLVVGDEVVGVTVLAVVVGDPLRSPAEMTWTVPGGLWKVYSTVRTPSGEIRSS
jgi:hypothetical protein